MRWSLGLAVTIVIAYSVLLILFDEFVAKPWRRRRWQRRAEMGDRTAQELLARAAEGERPEYT